MSPVNSPHPSMIMIVEGEIERVDLREAYKELLPCLCFVIRL